jgi:hypothetical protein
MIPKEPKKKKKSPFFWCFCLNVGIGWLRFKVRGQRKLESRGIQTGIYGNHISIRPSEMDGEDGQANRRLKIYNSN